ncbi:MAG: zinc-dependent alcohol dehydrogenase, partial [Spirochaetota bacterium]
IPDDMDYNVAACMDPLSIALHVVMRTKIQPGDSVLINGSGMQGLMSILCAQSMGADQIIVSGSGYRLSVAEKLGAIPINYRNEDVPARVKELTGGQGVKRVVECAGTAKGIAQAVEAVSKGGTISVVSLPKDDVMMPVKQIVLNEIDFVGNRANPNTLKKAIALAKVYKEEIASMITHEFPLTEYKQAYDTFVGRKDNSLKVVVKPGK